MKMKVNQNIVLAICVAALAVVCCLSVSTPMRFDKEQARRERIVKQRLVKIRMAEEQYRKRNGCYSGDFQTLVRGGYLAEELTIVPFSDEERFELSATMLVGKSGRQTPLMECGAQYQQYLNGLNENNIANLIEAANETGRYPGLKIGDLSTPNNNAGNWE